MVASAIAGSGVGHVVADDQTGDLFAAGDASALADALTRMTHEPARRQRMGAAGYARWRDEFSLERSASQVAELYKRVVAR